ncbi:fatty-acid--CoA ligase [Mycobacterium hodleri]|uniref:Fatty-acid--CoA ligase n=1 Tax=Mycolicibacterium hodleri TaxID=49897 RepID=A0A502EBC6_9MYCO|nr:fatty-acid--CoA ligase [Mycolicibacterium hodleri]TPG33826.1 fatty-acid--CoA ligase [Mycolicibacterium hodleri]
MTHWLHHSLVLASDYRVANPERVAPLLERRRDALVDLGAHHVLVYASTTDPERVLVMIALHAREPVLEVLRSRIFFDWFDAVGVEDFPAVFAGELVERLELSPEAAIAVPEVMVSVVTPVEDLATLRNHIRETSDGMRAGGVRKVTTFSAFDNPLEVMMLLQIDDEEHAQHWLSDSKLAADWLTRAGIGAYPPVFVGRFLSMLRIDETEGSIHTDDVDTDDR